MNGFRIPGLRLFPPGWALILRAVALARFMALAKRRLNLRRKEMILLLNAMDGKKFNERARLDALLKRLLQSDGFMPSSIDVSERPDFIITTADKKIGVEVTLSAYEEHVRASVLQS